VRRPPVTIGPTCWCRSCAGTHCCRIRAMCSTGNAFAKYGIQRLERHDLVAGRRKVRLGVVVVLRRPSRRVGRHLVIVARCGAEGVGRSDRNRNGELPGDAMPPRTGVPSAIFPALPAAAMTTIPARYARSDRGAQRIEGRQARSPHGRATGS
jgi:hypothetical protein